MHGNFVAAFTEKRTGGYHTDVIGKKTAAKVGGKGAMSGPRFGQHVCYYYYYYY